MTDHVRIIAAGPRYRPPSALPPPPPTGGTHTATGAPKMDLRISGALMIFLKEVTAKGVPVRVRGEQAARRLCENHSGCLPWYSCVAALCGPVLTDYAPRTVIILLFVLLLSLRASLPSVPLTSSSPRPSAHSGRTFQLPSSSSVPSFPPPPPPPRAARFRSKESHVCVLKNRRCRRRRA